MAQQLAGRWVISPQDLIAEFECNHRTSLDFAVKAGALAAPVVEDDGLALLQQQGIAHERARLEGLDPNLRVKRLGTPAHSIEAYEAAWQSTKAAVDEECDVIYQATLFTGDFIGFADFLVIARDDAGTVIRDAHGIAIYEPVDTKSARSAKRGAVLQVGAYAEAMVRLGLPEPKQVHLWLAGDTDWSGQELSLRRFLPSDKKGSGTMKDLGITTTVKKDRSFEILADLSMVGTYGYQVGYETNPGGDIGGETIAFQFQLTTTAS